MGLVIYLRHVHICFAALQPRVLPLASVFYVELLSFKHYSAPSLRTPNQLSTLCLVLTFFTTDFILQRGYTALMIATIVGDTTIMKLLLDAGADTEAERGKVRGVSR